MSERWGGVHRYCHSSSLNKQPTAWMEPSYGLPIPGGSLMLSGWVFHTDGVLGSMLAKLCLSSSSLVGSTGLHVSVPQMKTKNMSDPCHYDCACKRPIGSWKVEECGISFSDCLSGTITGLWKPCLYFFYRQLDMAKEGSEQTHDIETLHFKYSISSWQRWSTFCLLMSEKSQ